MPATGATPTLLKVIAFSVLVLTLSATAQARRLALVIGNDSYPQVTFHGRLVNDEITGTWSDRFQSGQFGWTVRTTK